ncbi:MAG TPA: isoprenylcysteine carboxylmethyltransferase family protein [Anaerolineales bacterium]|nr:isoprenylcysteine carboxylmethyltransferase family protein [Anaerolineales bacterium]HLO33875.1 isoprenylcysteine carboxylmethyltransferase family protein [Anaerolineales bacterium]
MITTQPVIAACWIIFILYWFISGRSVKSIQETRGWLGGNWYSIFYLIGSLFIGNFGFLRKLGIPTDRLAILLLPPTIVLNIIVILLLVVGLMIAIVARRTLAGNWSGAVALKKDHELITTGFYHYVRHPIYTGMLIMILGTALSFATLGACIGFLIILFGVLLKLNQEEALLAEHFAQEYLSYKKHTRVLIPFLW